MRAAIRGRSPPNRREENSSEQGLFANTAKKVPGVRIARSTNKKRECFKVCRQRRQGSAQKDASGGNSRITQEVKAAVERGWSKRKQR